MPAPGGGATAALHAAQAAALVAMVARYSDSAKYAEHADEITTITATADRLRQNALGLAEEDALLIFPEGANFTPQRRVRAIQRLRDRGLRSAVRQAEAMRRVLPPRPGGVAAALTAAPHADVVFVAHTGLEHLSTLRDLWRSLPMDKTLHLRWWFVPAADVPRWASRVRAAGGDSCAFALRTRNR